MHLIKQKSEKRQNILRGVVYTPLSVFVATFLFLLLSSTPAHAAPATFTVTNTNDSGAGSLRQAINDANANDNDADLDTIEFDIPGSEVHTIVLGSSLPTITEQVVIDGYTQSGAQENTAIAPEPLNGTIKIELDFSAVSDDGIEFQADNSIIKGLAMFSTTDSERVVSVNANNVEFTGNYGNLRADGMTMVDNQNEDQSNLVTFGSAYSGFQFGGLLPEERNVIAVTVGSLTSGAISINGSSVTVQGNYIGLAKDGLTDIGGGVIGDVLQGANGLSIGSGSGVVIGGTDEGAINVISGSSIVQLNAGTGGSVIQGNYIGTDYKGEANEGIDNGVGISNASGNLIGGAGAGEGNLFAGLSGSAVTINSVYIQQFDFSNVPQNVAILGNSIKDVEVLDYANFGTSNLAIDLFRQENTDDVFAGTFDFFDRGPTPNDVGDGDDGPNGFINTPVLKSAQQVGNQLTITYDLDAADSPSDEYRIEFFANDESSIFGYGPGETFLGSDTVSPGTDIETVLTVSGDQTNKALSSTTTAVDGDTDSGFGSTSEFSRNISIGSSSDFDSDGASTAMENSAPNSGDGNNDGILDSIQPTVTSFEIDSTGVYATLVTTGCSENGTVSSVDVSTLNKTDNGYDYPYGLTDFSLNCSRGDTVNVELYIHTVDNPDQYIPRKYNPTTETFTDIPDSTLTTATLGDSTALKLSYSVTDGGELDDDGEENGIIVDPVGLATESSTTINLADSNDGSLAETGDSINYIAIIVIVFSVSMISRQLQEKGNYKE